MKRIFITGDTHGILDFQKLIKLNERKNLSYDDYIIICGDAGIIWDESSISNIIIKYELLNTNILFIDGNHENYDLLKKYKVEEWNGGKIKKISEHIYYLMRGQIYTILGRKFLTLGGADSSDKEYRKEHISWWKDESITYNDIAETRHNLSKHSNKVDYVITHTPPYSSILEFIKILTQCGEAIPYYLKNKLLETQSNKLLDEVKMLIQYKHWYCGHLHTEQELKKTSILYQDIVELKD